MYTTAYKRVGRDLQQQVYSHQQIHTLHRHFVHRSCSLSSPCPARPFAVLTAAGLATLRLLFYSFPHFLSFVLQFSQSLNGMNHQRPHDWNYSMFSIWNPFISYIIHHKKEKVWHFQTFWAIMVFQISMRNCFERKKHSGWCGKF